MDKEMILNNVNELLKNKKPVFSDAEFEAYYQGIMDMVKVYYKCLTKLKGNS